MLSVYIYTIQNFVHQVILDTLSHTLSTLTFQDALSAVGRTEHYTYQNLHIKILA